VAGGNERAQPRERTATTLELEGDR
jgi:hypothetical protein